ncbi:hypothetical protein ILUMI_10063 [Ignelater luminosus]|uniref:Retrotransposon gag domain-containing protein n=1 Tax=Ignelater luminosus TaxID=2038154 RepID=A0A8K0GBU3_IGNLU|nr:hypothetical protein ILUMI_10063 [Ignelater luminosus]
MFNDNLVSNDSVVKIHYDCVFENIDLYIQINFGDSDDLEEPTYNVMDGDEDWALMLDSAHGLVCVPECVWVAASTEESRAEDRDDRRGYHRYSNEAMQLSGTQQKQEEDSSTKHSGLGYGDICQLLCQYNGSGEINLWFQRINLIQETYKVEDRILTLAVVNKLNDKALDWFHSKPSHVELSWKELETQLTDMFGRKENKLKTRRTFEQRMWKRDEAFNDYYHDRALLANKLQLEEPEIIEYVVEGIEDITLRNQAKLKESTTLNKLLTTMNELDYSNYSRIQSTKGSTQHARSNFEWIIDLESTRNGADYYSDDINEHLVNECIQLVLLTDVEQSNRAAAAQGPQNIQPFNAVEHMDGVPLLHGENLFRFLNSCELIIQHYAGARQFIQKHPEYYGSPRRLKTTNSNQSPINPRKFMSNNQTVSYFPPNPHQHQEQNQGQQGHFTPQQNLPHNPQRNFNQAQQYPSQPIPLQTRQAPQRFLTNKQTPRLPHAARKPRLPTPEKRQWGPIFTNFTDRRQLESPTRLPVAPTHQLTTQSFSSLSTR